MSDAPASGAARELGTSAHGPAYVLTCAVLMVVAAGAWIEVVSSAMAPDPMRGMAMAPTVRDGLAYVTAWTIMMAAMMLPCALPMIGLYAATLRSSARPAARAVHVILFTLIYLAVWAATGVPMYLASTQIGDSQAAGLAYVTAGVLVITGFFQLSPLKQVCLRHCRRPLGFFLGHWRPGWRGSLSMGWTHALYCLGCCWALMVVLVVAGAMGLARVLLIAAAVVAEKLGPGGPWVARGLGAALVPLGLAVGLRPDLALALRWQVNGEYFEACSCDFVYPCPTSGLAATPTKGYCSAGLVFHVDRGQHGTTTLDGLNFAVLLHTSGPMIAGNWTVGVILDERASPAQREALTAIASGQGGGPMAALGPLVGRFGGAEAKPIRIERTGMRRSVSIPAVLDIAVEDVTGASPDEPIYLDNVGHPVGRRLALAKASRGHIHAFGIDWDETSGRNNGHFAGFAWTS